MESMAKSADVASFRESMNRSIKSKEGNRTSKPQPPQAEEEVVGKVSPARAQKELDRSGTNTSVDLDESEILEAKKREE